ncbi:MAG: 50S ribosomal protein L18Ae [Candidatus Micrarchaeota archaeon]|nr:50S ribosomal protein L18Ae [Candidatus Micrarchaeota archaeon]
MRFVVSGEMEMKEERRKFKKSVEAPNEKFAVEKTYALIGGNHRLKRNKIKIDKVEKA